MHRYEINLKQTIRTGFVFKNIKKQRYTAVITQKNAKFAFKSYIEEIVSLRGCEKKELITD